MGKRFGGRTSQMTPMGLRVHALAMAVLCLTLLLNACALGSPDPKAKEFIKECILPTDQASTIGGHWRVTPIPIAFHQGDWQPDEIADITKAADTWNTFYTATQGIQVLDYGTGGNAKVSAQPVPTNVCAQGILTGSTFSGQVVIYKSAKWPHPGGATSTIALTSFCTSPAKPYPSTYMAYMEVNYQNFFTEGHKVPDLQTIVAHELGHLLGLNHSCDTAVNKAGTPDCSKPDLNPDYRAALMFPSFGFTEDLQGEQKRELFANDQGRANCLYQAVKK